jgi:hypothetical protein
MTEEEKTEIEREMNKGPSPATTPGITEQARPASPPTTSTATPPSATNGAQKSPQITPSPSTPGLPESHSQGKDAKAKRKITPEQREKLDAMEKERREKMKVRVEELSVKLVERLRPFVEGTQDAELQVWQSKIKTEAEDLKLESFGVEVSLIFPNYQNRS